MAKTIYLLGKSNLYNTNYMVFIERVANLFKTNIHYTIDKYSFFDDEQMNGSYFKDFGYKNELSILVSYYPLDEKNPNIEESFTVYDIEVPVEYKYDLSYTIVFYPNGFFFILEVPFNSTWDFFIEDLAGLYLDYYNLTYKEMVISNLETRDTYVNLLKQIGCKKVIILSDYQQDFIDELCYFPINKEWSFDEILKLIVERYSVTPLKLMDVLKQRVKISLLKDYHWSEAYKYVFIDKIK
ncbi:MAG: hypothetical protein WC951_05650 [Bacteroidales bacterium]